MNEPVWRIGPGFVLVTAALYYFGGMRALCALLLADAVHELGHLLAMLATRTEIRGLRLVGGGAVILCGDFPSSGAEAFVLAAGPLAGLLFGAAGLFCGNDFARYSGAAAILASAFNLLPALPMDGGLLLRLLAESTLSKRTAARLLRVTGNLCALLLAFALGRLHISAGIAAGIYLAALVNFPQMR